MTKEDDIVNVKMARSISLRRRPPYSCSVDVNAVFKEVEHARMHYDTPDDNRPQVDIAKGQTFVLLEVSEYLVLVSPSQPRP